MNLEIAIMNKYRPE